MPVELHDGSRILLRKVARTTTSANRGAAIDYIRARHRGGEIVTGLLYIDEAEPDMHGINGTVSVPLAQLPYEELCPGRDALLDAAAALPLTARRPEERREDGPVVT